MPTKYEINYALAFVTFIFIILGFIIGFIVILYKKKITKAAIEKKLKEQEFANQIIQTQVEIQEQTLKTISQEIHDNIGQVLSLTKLTVSNIQSQEKEVVEKLTTTKNLLNKVILDVKDLSKSLNTDSIELIGITKAIENEIEFINKTNINGVIEIDGDIQKLNPKIELVLFRVVQECLNNAIKHSQATIIKTSLKFTTNNLCIKVMDNGIGFNIKSTNNNGLGLKNMQNRVALIGGFLQIDSNQVGTKISINVTF